eukprot:scaffold58881_cov53-Phaeocystis_antarctica.AAC.3
METGRSSRVSLAERCRRAERPRHSDCSRVAAARVAMCPAPEAPRDGGRRTVAVCREAMRTLSNRGLCGGGMPCLSADPPARHTPARHTQERHDHTQEGSHTCTARGLRLRRTTLIGSGRASVR